MWLKCGLTQVTQPFNPPPAQTFTPPPAQTFAPPPAQAFVSPGMPQAFQNFAPAQPVVAAMAPVMGMKASCTPKAKVTYEEVNAVIS